MTCFKKTDFFVLQSQENPIFQTTQALLWKETYTDFSLILFQMYKMIPPICHLCLENTECNK